MKGKISILFSLFCLIAITSKSVSGQAKEVDKGAVESFNSISRQEIELLLADVAKTNPMILKKLENPEMRKQQIENLKQLLAFASQAMKDGLASDPTNRQEMDSIRAETIAVNYDKEINKDKGMPPFGYITEDQIKKYWGEPGGHEIEFQKFLDAKMTLLMASVPAMKDRTISEEETTQAREIFAKIRIYRDEFELKAKDGTLSKEVIGITDLNIKLQQAQFLSRLYADKVTTMFKATDAEIAAYIVAHPDIDPAKKRATAQALLVRVKAGESFAVLANKFSQDPGNTGANGLLHGGLYKDVPKGRMVPAFEAAALELLPGHVAPKLVETDFGYHIIKLDRKGIRPGAARKLGFTYDVRHILISSGVKDPDKPAEREVPINEYVRSKVETAKEKKILDDLIIKNKVQVPDDFTVPKPVAVTATDVTKPSLQT